MRKENEKQMRLGGTQWQLKAKQTKQLKDGKVVFEVTICIDPPFSLETIGIKFRRKDPGMIAKIVYQVIDT